MERVYKGLNMAKNIHRSKELDKHLGQKVKVTFWDNSIDEGILEFGVDRYCNNRYSLNRQLFFRKTHVIKIEEV